MTPPPTFHHPHFHPISRAFRAPQIMRRDAPPGPDPRLQESVQELLWRHGAFTGGARQDPLELRRGALEGRRRGREGSVTRELLHPQPYQERLNSPSCRPSHICTTSQGPVLVSQPLLVGIQVPSQVIGDYEGGVGPSRTF